MPCRNVEMGTTPAFMAKGRKSQGGWDCTIFPPSAASWLRGRRCSTSTVFFEGDERERIPCRYQQIEHSLSLSTY
jgi:hypothetical protein